MKLRLVPLPIAMLVAGCVPEGDFPSLAQRPGERDLSTEEPARAAADVAGDPALRARVAALRQQAVEGDRAFDAAYGPAEAAVTAAGAAASDSWVEAQQALSRLEAARAATTRALADLDRIAMTRISTPTSPSDFAEIDAAIAHVQRLAQGQQGRIDALRARLSGS